MATLSRACTSLAGFQDKEYRARRDMLATSAQQYRHGDSIPRIDYTQDELNTWKLVWDKVRGVSLTC
eukprot:8728-Heterococcus_DN1.PRE.1